MGGRTGKWFMPAQWQSSIRWAHLSSSCANHREQFHKLLTRWYFTPLRLAESYPTASPYCWRSCCSMGMLLHNVWSCPHLRPFWDKLTKITWTPCPAGPEFLLLLLGIESLPLCSRTVVCNIFHVAHLVIARKLKSSAIPFLVEFSDIVSTICIYGKTLANYKGSHQTFLRNWDSWLQIYPSLT